MSNKVELIKKVMDEVKDPALRDSLLHEITKDNSADSSTIDKAMKEFGLTNINKKAVGELATFATKSNIIGGFIISFGTIIFGLLVLFKAGTDSFGIIFGSFWICIGSAILFGVAKMSKIIKWSE